MKWINDYVERIAERVAKRVAEKAVFDERLHEPRVWLWRSLNTSNVPNIPWKLPSWRVSVVPIEPNNRFAFVEQHCVRMSEFFELIVKASGKELVIHPEETKKLQIELRDINEKT